MSIDSVISDKNLSIPKHKNFSWVAQTLSYTFLGMVGYFPFMVLPVIVTGFIDQLQISQSFAGFIASANLVGGAISAVVMSQIIHKYSLKKVAIVGLSILVIMDFLSSFIANPETLLVIRFFSGIGIGVVISAALSAISRSPYPDEGFSIFIGTLFVFSGVGILASPYLLSAGGMQAVFLLLSLMALIGLLFTPSLSKFKQKNDFCPSFLSFIKRKSVSKAFVGYALFQAANGSIWAYAFEIGLAGNLTGSQVGMVLAGSSFCGIVGMAAVLFFRTRYGRAKPIAIAIMIQIASISLLLSEFSFATFILALFLFQSAWSSVSPYFNGLFSDLDQTGRCVSFGLSLELIGQSIGPAIAAIVIIGGLNGSIYLSIVLYIATIILITQAERSLIIKKAIPDDTPF